MQPLDTATDRIGNYITDSALAAAGKVRSGKNIGSCPTYWFFSDDGVLSAVGERGSTVFASPSDQPAAVARNYAMVNYYYSVDTTTRTVRAYQNYSVDMTTRTVQAIWLGWDDTVFRFTDLAWEKIQAGQSVYDNMWIPGDITCDKNPVVVNALTEHCSKVSQLFEEKINTADGNKDLGDTIGPRRGFTRINE